MKDRFRKQYQEREWMRRVDISLLYQLEMQAADLRRVASDNGDPRLKPISDRITCLLAVAMGKMAKVELAAHGMPEDAKAKIPDPRLDSLGARRSEF